MDTIKLGKTFYANSVKYKCVGHDSGFIWGCSDEYSESIPFEFHQCLTVSKFSINSNKKTAEDIPYALRNK